MKIYQTLIEFLNLHELATECFFEAKRRQQHAQQLDVINKATSFEQEMVMQFEGKMIAVCITVPSEAVDAVLKELALDKTIEDPERPDTKGILLDRVSVSIEKMDRVYQAQQIAAKAGFLLDIYVQDTGAPHIWRFEQSLSAQNTSSVSIHEQNDNYWNLSWDEVNQRFLRPDRYHHFQAFVEGAFGFKFSEKTALKDFLSLCRTFYQGNRSQLETLLHWCGQCDELAQVPVTAFLYKLPRKIINILLGVKALLLKDTNDSFVIDGPVPNILFDELKNDSKTTFLNQGKIPFHTDTLPQASHPSPFMITLPHTAWAYGSIAEFFGISEELGRFYRSLPSPVYKEVSKEQALQMDIGTFFSFLGNHPKFRRLMGVWRQMNLPHFALSQPIELLSYPDILLLTIAKTASKIREDSVVHFPQSFEGLTTEQVATHVTPLIHWCELHHCSVYLRV